mmetsp:Transcript_57206/g.160486  ORF Transcript_57206/g.160486 Transcript_57206/m.160486 type:complete len:206 (+) Transcript_57206:393-1010(+)
MTLRDADGVLSRLELLEELTQPAVDRQARATLLRRGEAVGQDRLQQRGVLRGLGQKAQPYDPWQHEEQLDVAILAHLRQRWRETLCDAKLRHDVADRAEQGLVLHVARAHLPTLLPIHEARHEAHVVAQVRVHAFQATLDLAQVLAHGGERVHNVVRQHPRCHEKVLAVAALLRAVAPAQRRHRIEIHLHSQVVSPLAAKVGDRV